MDVLSPARRPGSRRAAGGFVVLGMLATTALAVLALSIVLGALARLVQRADDRRAGTGAAAAPARSS
jgi:hypothetical protein